MGIMPAANRPCITPGSRCNHPLGDAEDGDLPELNAKETLRYQVFTCRESGACDAQAIGACQHISVWIRRNDLSARGMFMEPYPNLDGDLTVTSMVCHHVLVMN